MTELIAPTRTAAFEGRLKKRYAAERRFKALGLAAILFSLAVLAVLLVTMTLNGLGGFQRAELKIEVDFAESGLSLDPSLDKLDAIRSLEAQGLPSVIEFYAAKSLGEEGAELIDAYAWRSAAEEVADNRTLLTRKAELWLPASDAYQMSPPGVSSMP